MLSFSLSLLESPMSGTSLKRGQGPAWRLHSPASLKGGNPTTTPEPVDLDGNGRGQVQDTVLGEEDPCPPFPISQWCVDSKETGRTQPEPPIPAPCVTEKEPFISLKSLYFGLSLLHTLSQRLNLPEEYMVRKE